MDGWEGIEMEMYNENVLEICGKCLRVRITLKNWVKPSAELLSVFIASKQFQSRTLCRECLEKIFALKAEKEEIFKAGKLIIKLCKCGSAFHRLEKIWFQLSKMQTENLNGMIKDGKVEVVRDVCPDCKRKVKEGEK